MIDSVTIEMMSTDFLLWRCLHSGPLSQESIDRWDSASELPWAQFRARNIPLLTKLTQAYGSCAVLARDGDHIVGHLRFYPKAVCGMPGAGGLCLQQEAPSGPANEMGDAAFPPLNKLQDKTIRVHCLMTGSPSQQDRPYQRKGLGSRLVRHLIQWATMQGWRAIEATAYEDLPIVYSITGQAGKTFWQKLGFRIASIGTEPELEKDSDFTRQMRKQATAAGLDAGAISNAYTMRLDLPR